MKTGIESQDLYDYTLPRELIAEAPAMPRDSARLLVYRMSDQSISFDIFSNISHYLPPHAVLVFNETKVIPARLSLKKPTGGKVTVLCTSFHDEVIEGLVDRRIRVGESLAINDELSLIVDRLDGPRAWLRPVFSMKILPEVLEQFGQTPLPPYLKHSPLSEEERRQQYQTIFARATGSVAAPTASLHFTTELLESIRRTGCDYEFVTLHVGLGTFAPLTEENLQSGRLHHESYSIEAGVAERLTKAKKEGRPIIAVGTTVVRTLETAADSKGGLKNLSGSTDLFIRPGYSFKFVDGMVTNFHVPKSSLMMLVAAKVGREQLMQIYQRAINEKIRFFSFGDGMLIIP